MKKTFALVLLGSLFFQSIGAARQAASSPRSTASASAPRIRVHFSPGGDCTDAIVAAMDKAAKSIDIQAYSFTSAPIAQAAAKAHARGVAVRVVLDKSQRSERYTSATFLANQSVPVWIDAKHAIAHNKIILIDGKTILTGSFNFTKSAEERNAENLLIIEGHSELMAAYQANFDAHLAHSEPYAAVAESEAPKATPSRKPPAARARKAA